ncbi:MAG: DUF2953 domain-containing protein [Methanoregula sp.]|nr:MAG: DUF2953 domain-containing protein [Methanoregula sp.]
MDPVILVIYLSGLLAGLILFSILVLWLVPVRVFIRYRYDRGRQDLEATARWGIIAIRSTKRAGRSQTVLLIFSHVLFSFDRRPEKKEITPPPSYRPADIRAATDLVPVIRNLAMPAIRIGSVLCRMSRFERCNGRVRIGLGDPAATGMLYGSYWATRFAFTASHICIDMEPVFDHEVLAIDLSVRYRIGQPLRILLSAARELLRPDVRAGITALRSAGLGALVT